MRTELPTVKLSGNRISVLDSPTRDYGVATQQAVEILEQNDCSTRVVSKTEVEVSERCPYVGGIYRIVYPPRKEQGVARQLFIKFHLSRKNSSSFVFLVDTPIELPLQAPKIPPSNTQNQF
ncbi:MAG: hypothetical protein HY537_06970 [Deltaproteobacteria bacterium]|nr:hypothetical protein [Deltaproteobacteria bacterium]